jgi:hypothetical protein
MLLYIYISFIYLEKNILHYRKNSLPKMSQEPSEGLTSYTKDSLFELATKNPTNTYICIHENVYDVTQFQDEVIL